MKKQLLFIFFAALYFPSKAQKLLHFEVEQCKDPIVYVQITHNRVISQKLSGDTLQVKIGLIQNCSFDPENPFFFFRKDTLHLQTNGLLKPLVMCACYFTMNFILTGMNDTIHTLVVDDLVLNWYQSKYIAFPTNEVIAKKHLLNHTLRGRKIGYWINTDQYATYTIAYYGDGTNYKNHFLWQKTYLEKSNELLDVTIYCPEDTPLTFSRPEYLNILHEIEKENP
jgi:hypothetical protein